VGGDQVVEPAEAAQAGQPQQGQGPGQVGRAVVVAVDELVPLGGQHPPQVVAEGEVAGGLLGPGEPLDLGRRPLGARQQVQVAAVVEGQPVDRVERGQLQPVLQLLAGRPDGRPDDLGHGQDRRAGVEAVAADGGRAAAPAGDRLGLDHDDVAAGRGQVDGGREAGQAGPHDHGLSCQR
jgi:hypothetical protein